MRGLSLVVASRGHSSSRCAGLSLSQPLVAEHRLQTRRLSSCGSWAQLLRGMWDLPRPGLEPVSPALAGGFSTTAPPGKPLLPFFLLSCCLSLLLQILEKVTLNTYLINKAGLPWWCSVRIHLPMQGTRVRALVQEIPTCRRANKPVRHNY